MNMENIVELENIQCLENDVKKKESSIKKKADSVKKNDLIKTNVPTKLDKEKSIIPEFVSDLSNSALSYVLNVPLKLGKTLMKPSQNQLKVMLKAGSSLKDMREVAGLTVRELNDSLNLKDKTLIEAVENGTATLSFELILRLAALYARNDPIPFIIKYTRTYNPAIGEMLNDWGIGRIPLQFERERQIVNIYRSNDAARKLSDAGFDKVLQFTRQTFEMALHFVAESENVEVADNKVKDKSAIRNSDKGPAKEL